MARFEYFFRETTSGLRRNGLVAFAAIRTTFIALLLFGLALLIRRQVSLMIEATTGNVEVAVYLTDPVNPDTVRSLTETLTDAPGRRRTSTTRTRRRPATRFRTLFAEQEALVNNVDCDALPASLRVKLDGSRAVRAGRRRAQGRSRGSTASSTRARSWTACSPSRGCSASGVLLVAFVMLVSASILIANTVRMGLFARRKEIGIMKLVGRDELADPAPVPRRGAVREPDRGGRGDPVPVRHQGRVHRPALRARCSSSRGSTNKDVIAMIPWLLIAGAVVALLAGLVGMRRFLDV